LSDETILNRLIEKVVRREAHRLNDGGMPLGEDFSELSGGDGVVDEVEVEVQEHEQDEFDLKAAVEEGEGVVLEEEEEKKKGTHKRKTEEAEEEDEEMCFFLENSADHQRRLNKRQKFLKEWWDAQFRCFGGDFPNKRRRQPTAAELRPFFEEMFGPDRSKILAERQKKQADTLRRLILNHEEITESILKNALVSAKRILKSNIHSD